MVIEKETRIIDLTVEQFTRIIADSVLSFNPPGHLEDVPLNVEQACQFLGNMPKPTLYFKCNKGDMPHVKQGGRLYFFKKDLVDWLRKHQVMPIESITTEFFSDFKTKFQAKK